LIDTAGCAAVAAGHDYNYGNRITTIALSVQYQTVEPGASVVAYARCTRRGRQINYAEVIVRSDNGKELARGLVTVSTTGRRDTAPVEAPEREN
jgi:acyl-coenzyme A thioesterase PaaI-like protein